MSTLALILSPLAASAQTTVADKVSPLIGRFAAGLTCSMDSLGRQTATDTVNGAVSLVDDQDFISTGRQVPAVLGLGFGVKAQLADPFAIRTVTISVTHPPMGPEGVMRQSWQMQLNGIRTQLTSFRFEDAFELVIGDWTISAVQGDLTLYRVAFTVVPIADFPGLADLCAQEDVS